MHRKKLYVFFILLVFCCMLFGCKKAENSHISSNGQDNCASTEAFESTISYTEEELNEPLATDFTRKELYSKPEGLSNALTQDEHTYLNSNGMYGYNEKETRLYSFARNRDYSKPYSDRPDLSMEELDAIADKLAAEYLPLHDDQIHIERTREFDEFESIYKYTYQVVIQGYSLAASTSDVQLTPAGELMEFFFPEENFLSYSKCPEINIKKLDKAFYKQIQSNPDPYFEKSAAKDPKLEIERRYLLFEDDVWYMVYGYTFLLDTDDYDGEMRSWGLEKRIKI